jgi:predicted metal-dependent phosphoesterase TrpH
MERQADLHTHSTFSDGEMSVGLLLQKAQSLGIKYISITDHENTRQNEYIQEILRYTNFEIKVIPGIEISTDYQNQEIHIVVYYHPEETKEINAILEPLREKKLNRVKRIIKEIEPLGFNFKNFSLDNSKTFNRMCIARYMYYNSNLKTIEEVFKKYLDNHNKEKNKSEYPNTKEIVSKLSKLNCFVGIAHPDFLKDWDKIKIIQELIKEGIKGIEYHHPIIPNYLETKVLNFIQENGLIPLGGSDFHGYDTKRRELGKYNIPNSSAEYIMKYLKLESVPKLFFGQD